MLIKESCLFNFTYVYLKAKLQGMEMSLSLSSVLTQNMKLYVEDVITKRTILLLIISKTPQKAFVVSNLR